jgi:hypothetical protein
MAIKWSHELTPSLNCRYAIVHVIILRITGDKIKTNQIVLIQVIILRITRDKMKTNEIVLIQVIILRITRDKLKTNQIDLMKTRKKKKYRSHYVLYTFQSLLTCRPSSLK